MSEAKVKVVEDLPGVGPAIAEKLKEAGYKFEFNELPDLLKSFA